MGWRRARWMWQQLRGPAPPSREGGGLPAARFLSALILTLMVIASAGGLLITDLYRDAASVNAMLRAYDLVTLTVVAPVLALVLLPSVRESRRAQLVWVSALAYGAYNYAMYVFGSAFNSFFLMHVALFSLSVFALALALVNLDVTAMARQFRRRAPVRVISGLLLLTGVSLGAMWIFYSLRFAFTGEFPKESLLVLPQEAIHLGYTLDLALLVPTEILAAVLLWRRAPWGYVLATVTLLFGAVYQVNYMTALVFQAQAEVPGATSFDPVEPYIAAVFAIGAAIMLTSMKPSP
jgi:hypothetical protein